METIGEILRKEREKKGFSLEEVSHRTKIHLRILQALEENKFQSLPATLYVKSFLKKYSQFLGLDPHQIIEKYLSLEPKEGEQVLVLKEAGGKRKGFVFSKRLVFNFIGGILVLYFLIWTIGFLTRPRKKLPKRVESRALQKKTSNNEKGPLFKKEKPLVLKIVAGEDSWIQLKADGKIIFQNVLRKGMEESWEAKEKFELWVGNAQGISLFLNGKALRGLGRGVKKNITVDRSGIKFPSP